MKISFPCLRNFLRKNRLFLLPFCWIFSTAFKVYRTSEGLAVKWFMDKIPVQYYINANGSADIPDLDTLIQYVKESFSQWEVNGAFIKIEYRGLTSLKPETESTQGKEIKNVIGWIESGWTDDEGSIGVTTVIYYDNTGEIVEADMALNGEHFTWTLDPPSPCPSQTTVDLRNVITHEAGHFLGMDHSSVQEATMFQTSPPCETKKRDLAPDDINGIIYLYPEKGIPHITSIYPRRGTTSDKNLTLNIYGDGFTGSFLIYLRGPSGILKAKSSEKISDFQVKGIFDLSKAEIGIYSVVVINNPFDNPYEGELSDSFEVLEGPNYSYEGGCGCSSSKGAYPFTLLLFLPLSIFLKHVSRK